MYVSIRTLLSKIPDHNIVVAVSQEACPCGYYSAPLTQQGFPFLACAIVPTLEKIMKTFAA